MTSTDRTADGTSRRSVVTHGLLACSSLALGGVAFSGTADSRRGAIDGATAASDDRSAIAWTRAVNSHLDLVVVEYTATIVAEAEGTVTAGVATGPPDAEGDSADEFWLQRRDGDGDVVWSALYGGEESVVSALVRAGSRGTADAGGHVVVGSVGGGDPSGPGGEGASARIVKTDGWSEDDGFTGPEMDWEWTDDSDADSGFAAVAAGPSGFAAAGTNDAVPSIVAFDADGDERWAETYDVFEASARASVQALVSTDDGNFAMLVVDAPECPSQTIKIVVADGADGERMDVWSYDADALRDVVRTDDGYAFGGWMEDDGGSEDFLLAAADANGDRRWTETYGGPTEDDADVAPDLVRTGDGYVLGGERVNADGDERSAQLVHTDRDGDQRWATIIHDDDEAQQYTAAAVVDGYVYVLGAANDGDGDASEKQPTLWKVAADDVVAPDGSETGDSGGSDGMDEGGC